MIFEIPKSCFVGHLDLQKTFNSEQCPTDIWDFKSGKWYTHINVNDRWERISIWENTTTLFVESDKDVSQKLLYHFWSEYDLVDFYQKFREDRYLSRVIKACKGLRLMRDLDVNYRIIEAILTQNSSVKQIRNMEKNLREFYGNGYTFDLNKIARAREKDLQQKCKVGYRARYLIDVARKILEGELNIEELKKVGSERARELLTEIRGIGPKVADIILLYGFGKPDVFPMDVWLRRALVREYFNGKKTSDKKLREFALEYFGNHAGIAHLYMFYYERKLRRPVTTT